MDFVEMCGKRISKRKQEFDDFLQKMKININKQMRTKKNKNDF
jgi:hypothetical protein